ncbi:SMI1/KNR4 family protein [Streptosporangium jomthongense]|uniref:SMI1/KNR4 family protein n=1 Tax=Streptosporangium jomthongense TaxID=1193683 RepID=A0ABV8F0D2_9ACTN
MSRLITSRWVRLALVAAVVTAVVVAVLRLRRPPAVRRQEGLPEPSRAETAAAPGVRAAPEPRAWPPAPILGTPNAEILKGYATVTRPPAFLTRQAVPRTPLDGAARRVLTRWAAAACALGLLAVGAQVLDDAVFSGRRHAGEPCAGETVCQRAAAPVTEILETPAPAVPDADCDPAARTPHRRPVSPRVTRAVDRQWNRIERWLRANTPRTYRALSAPARSGTIAVAEAQMGLRLPDDLRASLLRHNGGAPLLMGESPLDVRGIRDTWRTLCEVDGVDGYTGEEIGERSEWWDGRMIPFTADGTGCHLLIDSVARDVGGKCEDEPIGFTPGGVRLRSYYALLKATADALETGGRIGYWRPRAAGGALDWEIVDAGAEAEYADP